MSDTPPPPPPPPSQDPWAMPDGPPTAPPLAPAYDEDLPPHRGRSRVGLAIAIVAVLILVIGSVAYVLQSGGDGGSDGAASGVADADPEDSIDGSEDDADVTPSPPPVEEVSEEEFLALVEELEAYVARARGLEFLQPVVVELVDGAVFDARLLETFEEDVEEIEQAEVFYRALGLLPGDADLVEELKAIYAAGVLGFYDPETNELVVRGATPTAYVRKTIVHELVHALDDQHFELFREEYDDRRDEISVGFSSIVEGNAERIAERWLGEQPADVRQQVEAEERAFADGIDVDAFPEILLFEIGAPYQLGLILVGQLARDGGERAVDAALEDPPTTSEQVLDFRRYEAREPRIEVPAPPADGPIVDEGVVGALFLFGLLTTGDDAVPISLAGPAIQGWGGDWAVTWEDGDADCARIDLVGDTQADTDEIEAALDEWAGDGPASVTTIDGRVRVESCIVEVGGSPPQA